MTPREAADEYAALDFAPLPLLPGTKKAFIKDWPTRAPSEMWELAPPDANIGLRCGGEARLAVIDADDDDQPQTSENVMGWLAECGYPPGEYPIVATPSGGRHFYVAFVGTLPGHSRNLSPDVGAGEFRYGPGAYVAAPPSTVDGRTYALVAGDLRLLPRIAAADILPLLKDKRTEPEAGPPPIPRLAWRILSGDVKTIGKYPTRSEAEQACIASLIRAGRDFDGVLNLFRRHAAAGKFADMHAKNPKRAIAWLRRSYTEAKRFCATHESYGRRLAAAAIAWASDFQNWRDWPGRTRLTDRAVFLAHATIAHRAGRVDYAADCRTLAELAAVSHVTAAKATRRLVAAALLTLSERHAAGLANRFRLCVTFTLHKSVAVMECKLSAPEAFRGRYLGLEGAAIWEALALPGGGRTAEELAEATGIPLRVVRRKLERMQNVLDFRTGELSAMVCADEGGRYRRADVSLDWIARLLGTEGALKRQQRKYAEERRIHRRALELGKESQHAEASETSDMLRVPTAV